MREFLYDYQLKNIDNVNRSIMDGVDDIDIVEYIVDACKTLEIIESVTYLGYEYQDYSDKIDEYAHIESKIRNSVKSKKKNERYRYINDSRLGEIKLKFKIDFNGEVDYPVVKILIPLPDESGYYLLNGKKYMMMYQIVDNSTYVIKRSVVLKTMVKLSIAPFDGVLTYYRGTSDEKLTMTEPLFGIDMGQSKATREINIMLFYLSKFGFRDTMRYFNIDHLCKLVSGDDPRKDGYVYIRGNSQIYLEVYEKVFDNNQYLRSIVGMLTDKIENKHDMENIEDKNGWIQSIGKLYTPTPNSQMKKGFSSILFFERMLDGTTKKVLRLHPIHLQDTYSIVRWMVFEFNNLRRKSNFDLNNKRIRRNELTASLLRYEFGERANRVLARPDKVEMSKIRDVFKMPSDVIISSLRNSGLLRYDERVNDMDIWDKFRVTAKGPNTMGTSMKRKRGENKKKKRKSNHISNKYRTIDPSYVGKVDLNVCGTSDPGTTLTLTTNCNMHGLYFGTGIEPETNMFEFAKMVDDIKRKEAEEKGKMYIGLKYDDAYRYYSDRKGLEDNLDKIQVAMSERSIYKMYIDVNIAPEDKF